MDFSEKEIFLGEIVLCYNKIVRYSKKEKKKEKEEFAKIAAHGLLHLLGFNHGEKMFQIQESILK
jgi:rRNA maturation RNase YbeY